jgi:hypothetical protein
MAAELNVFRLGDIGQILSLTVKEDGAAIDIAAATGLKVWLKPPKGDVIEKAGTLISGGTTGKFGYTFVAGDLPISRYAREHYVGVWTAEGQLTLGSAAPVTTSSIQFRVEDVLRAV